MNQSFDWNQFELLEPPPSNNQTNEPSQNFTSNDSFDWNRFEQVSPEKQEESFISDIPRHAVRSGSRIAETIAGMPGDIASFLKFMVSNVPGAAGIAGEVGKKYFPEQFQSLVEGNPEMAGSLPNVGSGQLQEASEVASQGYTKAKNPAEEKSDEIFQDITALFMPVKGKLPGFVRTLGTELAAQLAKEGTGLLGGSKDTQNIAKAATMFGMGVLRPGKANEYAASLYEKSNRLLPGGAQVSGKKISADLEKLVSNLEKGIETTDKRQVLKPARELLAKVQDGKINVEELVAAKRDINSLRGDPETVKGARKLLSNIGKNIDSTIASYEPQNPKFVKAFREANEAFGTIAQSTKVSNYIDKMANKLKLPTGIGILFEASHGGLGPIAPAAAGLTAGYGSLKAAELAYRIIKSPVLRKHYFNVLKNGLRENSTATMKSLIDLDESISQAQ